MEATPAELGPPRDSAFEAAAEVARPRPVLRHPVAYSAWACPGPKPVAARASLDEKLVVFRTSAGITGARDLCLHRGARLSLGEMEGDELVCGFHGFHYNRFGHCTRIPRPSRDRDPVPALPPDLRLRRALRSWSGCALAGEAPAAPLPDWPEAEQGAYELIPLEPLDWKASAGRHTENFNDVAHLSWVHIGTFGHRETPEVIRYPVDEGTTGSSIVIPEANQHDRDPYGKLPDRISKVRYVQTIDLPFASRLLVDYLDGRHLYLFDVAAPYPSIPAAFS